MDSAAWSISVSSWEMMAAMSASTARSVAGKRTSELPSDVHPEIVHRDDLVILP